MTTRLDLRGLRPTLQWTIITALSDLARGRDPRVVFADLGPRLEASCCSEAAALCAEIAARDGEMTDARGVFTEQVLPVIRQEVYDDGTRFTVPA